MHLFDLPPGYRRDFHAEVKRQMARRLHLAPVFPRKLAPMPLQFANPVWVDDDAVDLDYHVQRVTLPPPGTLAQLDDCVGRLHAELLDRSRPLWRLHVIDGLRKRPGRLLLQGPPRRARRPGRRACWRARCSTCRRARRAVPPGARAPWPPSIRAWSNSAAAALRHDAGQYIKLVRHLPDVVRTLAGLLGPRQGGAARRAGCGRTSPSARRRR